MGVEPFLITSSLIGVLAQRLIRSICPNCKEKNIADKEILKKLSLDDSIKEFTRGKGCPNCLKSGYKGRTGIFELLLPDTEMRSLILSRTSSEDIKRMAQKNGMKTLREDGIEKLKLGITTPEEVIRITQEAEEF